MRTRKQQASRAALELIKRFEGYRRAAARLADGRWTIGYGHTRTARAGAQVSEDDAEALLIYDLMEISAAIGEWVYTPLNQNQFDALAAFVFNIGLEPFRHSVVLRRLNEGAVLQAAYAMELWRRADFEGESIVVDALVRRRAAEKALFLTPLDGFVPAPTQVLRPAFDAETADRAPVDAVEIAASLDGEEATAERVEPALAAAPELEPPAGPEPEPERQPYEAETSRTEVAAAALAARLDQILRQDEPDEATQAEAVEPAAEAEAAPELQGPETEAYALQPEPDALERAPEVAGLFAPEPMEASEAGLFAPGLLDGPEGAGSPYSVTRYRIRRGPSLGGAPAMLALGAFGLLLFAAGLFWSFNVKRSPQDGLFTGPWMGGLVIGLVGIVCMAVAIYFLLDRLGGRDEDR